MNIIDQQREQVIRENNTAQKQLLDILENYSRQATTLHIQQPLYGDLDLLPLKELGFGLINNIQFSNGSITSIQNVPKGIISLICPENLLKTIENLPSSLNHINLSGNVLNSINVSNLKNLQTLYLSNNKLTNLENLPSRLVELKCDSNLLQQLDLQDLVNLKHLNISNNKITLVENMSEKIELIMENNPGITFRNSDISQVGGDDNDINETNTNYTDALNEYFRMKDEYEKKIHTKKKMIYEKEPNKKMAKQLMRQYNPKCVKCSRPVGTIFKKDENNTYKAICGDTRNPCNLNIEIFTGTLLNFQTIFDITKEDLDDVRDIVIRQKLDTLFDYVSEEEATKLFKTQTEVYIDAETSHKGYLEKYNEMHNNPIKKQQIQDKLKALFSLVEKNKELIDEYKKTHNREFLKTAVDLQRTDIKSTIDSLRSLKHGIMEINSVDTKKTFPINTLFQNPNSLSNIGYSTGEPSRVISFTI